MSLHVETSEVGEVCEEGSVGGTNGELGFLKLGQDSEFSRGMSEERFSKYVALKHYNIAD